MKYKNNPLSYIQYLIDYPKEDWMGLFSFLENVKRYKECKKIIYSWLPNNISTNLNDYDHLYIDTSVREDQRWIDILYVSIWGKFIDIGKSFISMRYKGFYRKPEHPNFNINYPSMFTSIAVEKFIDEILYDITYEVKDFKYEWVKKEYKRINLTEVVREDATFNKMMISYVDDRLSLVDGDMRFMVDISDYKDTFEKEVLRYI